MYMFILFMALYLNIHLQKVQHVVLLRVQIHCFTVLFGHHSRNEVGEREQLIYCQSMKFHWLHWQWIHFLLAHWRPVTASSSSSLRKQPRLSRIRWIKRQSLRCHFAINWTYARSVTQLSETQNCSTVLFYCLNSQTVARFPQLF